MCVISGDNCYIDIEVEVDVEVEAKKGNDSGERGAMNFESYIDVAYGMLIIAEIINPRRRSAKLRLNLLLHQRPSSNF